MHSKRVRVGKGAVNKPATRRLGTPGREKREGFGWGPIVRGLMCSSRCRGHSSERGRLELAEGLGVNPICGVGNAQGVCGITETEV